MDPRVAAVLLGSILGLAGAAPALDTPALVKDIHPGPQDSSPSRLAAFGDILVFAASDPAGFRTWISDGTEAGTVALTDDGLLSNAEVSGGAIYFARFHPDSGTELWASDGTPAGTFLVADLVPGPDSSFPQSLTDVNGTLFFDGFDASLGRALFKSDGTAAGTTLVKSIHPPNANFPIRPLTAAGGLLFFVANDTVHGREVWRSDGTASGTFLVKDINPGSFGSDPNGLVEFQGMLYFSAFTPNEGAELWRSDGTEAGTASVEIVPGFESGGPEFLTEMGGALYFAATDAAHGREIWRSDGTAAGTALVADVNPGPAGSEPLWLTTAGAFVLFEAFDPVHGRELWRTDGTASGTVLVMDINSGPADARVQPSNDLSLDDPITLTTFGATAFFMADDGVHGSELWASDGTAAGTLLLADINPGASSSQPEDMTVAGNRLFFVATEPATNRELWSLVLEPEANAAPVATADGYVASEDVTLVVDAAAGVLANDLDPEGDPLTAMLVTGPANGALALAADGSFSYAPDANFSGNDGFSYRASDPSGALSDVAAVAITVNAVNDAPAALDDAYGIVADTVLVVGAPGILGNDTDLEGSALSAALVTAPANGAVGLNLDGSFSYMPAAGFIGIDGFTYQATDGAAASTPATVTIAVSGAAIAFVSNNEASIPGGLGSFTGFPAGPSLSGLAVAFPGTGAGGQAGLYAQVGSSETLRIADLTTPIPGGSGTFTALRDLALSATPVDPIHQAAFIGEGGDSQQGLYAMSFGDPSGHNSPVLLADLETSIPGGQGTFTALREPALSFQPGDPCHEAAFIGDGSGGQQGLYAVSFGDASCDNAPVVLVDLETPLPGGAGTFTSLSEPTLSAIPGDPCHEAAFIGNGSGGQQGLYAVSFGDASCSSSPVRLVDLGTSIPGGSGSFTALHEPSLSFTPGDPCHEAAFIGDGPGGQQGVYSLSFGDTACAASPAAIADRSTSIPQGLGAFTGFEVVSSSSGHTAFLGTGAGGQKGIYLASTLTKVVDLSDTLTGAPLVDLRLDRAGLSASRLGFAASFTDGSEAIFEVTIDFAGTNEPPSAAADSYEAVEDFLLTVAAPGVLGNDFDAEGGSLTAALESGPSHGSLTLDADGAFQYLPDANFNGVDSFIYRASDAEGAVSNVATVTISIAAVNDAPVAAVDAFETMQDTPLSVPAPGVLGNDTDVDSPALFAALETGPANGTLTLGADGSFTYAPNAGFAGADSFSYRASDGAAASAPATVTIMVAPAPGAESWTPTGSLIVPRTGHTATLLPNGKVLVTGGHNASGLLRTAEIYDPANGVWSVTGNLGSARSGHTATLLPSGRVLVAGGLGGSGALKSAEVYDPATGTWASTGALGVRRLGHTATLLGDGTVLVAGGGSRRAELYNPSTGKWSPTGSMNVSRSLHSATLLPDGAVLAAGGLNGLKVLRSTEVYEPSTGKWRATGSLVAARTVHAATALLDGTVLVSGGVASNGAASAQAEIYDPAAGRWTATGRLGTARSFHAATLLPDGRVLVSGGYGSPLQLLDRAELFDPATGEWSPTANLAAARASHTATLLLDGRVLVTGGGILGLRSSELFGSP
jgi:ELWxxDGT repeat protein/VCBS repeat-containing protein